MVQICSCQGAFVKLQLNRHSCKVAAVKIAVLLHLKCRCCKVAAEKKEKEKKEKMSDNAYSQTKLQLQEENIAI